MKEEKREKKDLNLGGMLIRVFVSMIVLAVAAFFTPYFSITGWIPLLMAAIAIGIIDYLIERFTGFDASPFGRGITGFIVSALIIYATGFMVQGVGVSFIGSILAALAIGIINMLVPGRSVL
ncbi:phage holin family protein [Marinisporobacter balticus]|uniref:Superfamily IV 4 TMS phage holin n=1 Tax=Marinisporobacter balticus TaxID=2018667 RepID=A0A4R2KQB0_9FIRM|nr:phage holin family protein [Marinisporobacter balticus]TCO72308.1 superfamily IV 4 TMS phage holin [Marinisporobacter balticus]